jgi:quinol monooxygenase YgiN
MGHVSITGLRLKSVWAAPLFWWHAIASMRQAQAAPGCLRVEARTIDGVAHTLSVWQDRAAMIAFVRSGAHRRAIRAFDRIATGMTLGFETERVPDWSEVPELLRARGRVHGAAWSGDGRHGRR